MVKVSVVLFVLAVSAAIGFVNCTSPPSADCSTVIFNLADCLSYVSNGSTISKPQGSCCSGLKTVLKTNQECLCEAFKNSAQFGVTLNQTKAVGLPAACGVSTPPISNCGLPGGAPSPAPANSPKTPSPSPKSPKAAPSPSSPSPSSSLPVTETPATSPQASNPGAPAPGQSAYTPKSSFPSHRASSPAPAAPMSPAPTPMIYTGESPVPAPTSESPLSYLPGSSVSSPLTPAPRPVSSLSDSSSSDEGQFGASSFLLPLMALFVGLAVAS